ncbi:YdeI/OmpD-associated family protein [Membranicola marinus]|uniref:YdeI/OmpD-associated family protein n=1 Tax=Membranihabitans marinus TaxID=1227546 RepID=A0A953LEH5_9BACT|nr:YdeI/OmpD-associated family protein [Membranihabitans marinus]MBY5959969.1 YdeI/OmpD-associated family protein [Membranihabitans marinus]
MAKTVEAYIESNKQWADALIQLRKMCLNSGMNEAIKWGAPIYTWQGKNIVGVMAFKSYVGLWFHQGVFLKDPYHMLQQSSESTKGLRKMMFYSLQEFEEKKMHIPSYINEAVQNQKAGKEIPVKRSGKLEVPIELQHALDNNELLKSSFFRFTPGKQREFAEYIRSAKQNKTKERRITKISGLILSGKGLNDQYK